MKGDFQTFDLPGGILLHICPAEKFKTVATWCYIHRPLRAATVTPNALVPFVLARGSEKFPTRRDISRRLEELFGADLEVRVEKFGEIQSVAVGIKTVSDWYLPQEESLLESGLALLQDILFSPLVEGGAFVGEYVRGEKEILGRKIESKVNDKARYAVIRCLEELCKGEDFALYQFGRTEDLAGITPVSLYEEYQNFLARGRMDLFIVGRVEVETVLRLVEEVFSRDGGLREPLQTVKREASRVREVIEELPVNQGKISLGFRTGATCPDDGFYPLLVCNGILGGFPHSKLFRNVREKASLAYYAFSRLEITKGLMVISAGIDVHNYERARDIMLEQVEALRQGEISDEEIEFTQKGLINRIRSAGDDPGTLIGFHVERFLNGRVESTNQIIQQISDVSKEDIIRAAREVELEVIYFLKPPTGGGRSG